MRKVLIISPRFPPSNAPDMQRVRLALPLLESRGWVPEVVCVDAARVIAPLDPLLMSTLPPRVAIHRVSAFSQRWTRRLGVGSLTARCYYQLSKAVDRLLREGSFDLVFFSTTEFGLLPLGITWLNRFQVPFVVDLQDPWVNPYYRENRLRPPGGIIKHSVHQWLAGWLERRVMQQAARIMVVSERYTETLCRRYDFLPRDKFVTIPFAATPTDLEVASSDQVTNPHFSRSDGKSHWVYVGRCGPDMTLSLGAFLTAFQKYTQTHVADASRIRLHFIGTDYAAAAAASYWVKPIAERLGIGEFVREQPARIPYFETLRCLLDADALIVPGSGDASYTASKIYPYIAASRPLLTVFHEDSSVNDVMRRASGGTAVSFSSEDDLDSLSGRIYARWFANRTFEVKPAMNNAAFEEFLAPAMTDRIVECFDRAICESPLGKLPV